jgi:hypothetical protein
MKPRPLLVGMFTASALLLAGADAPSSDIAEIVTSYQNLRRLTPEPVLTDPLLAIGCAAPTKKMLAQARKSNGPHMDAAINIYASDEAAEVLAGDRSRAFPVGAVVVKEKRNVGYGTDGIGGMIKRAAGFDPKNGDWEYFYFSEESGLTAGRLRNCIDCHRGAKATDYVFGSWASPDRLTIEDR